MGGDLDLVADLRGLLARDVPVAFVPAFADFLALAVGLRVPLARGARLAFGFAMLSVIIRSFLLDDSQIEQDAEVLRDGRPAHLEMFRKRVDGAGGLDEEVEHPAPCRMADCCEDVGLAIGNHHHAANIRKR